MGYFSNGSEGERYQAAYCQRCAHGPQSITDPECPVWGLHLLHNYDECNKPESFLHVLIPRQNSGTGNSQCTMFVERVLEQQEKT